MPLVSFLLGSASGAVAAIAGAAFAIRARRRRRAEDLRVAMAAELETLSYLDGFLERGDYEGVTKAVERGVVYEENADELGRLDDAVATAIVSFYTDLGWLRDLQDPEDKTDRIDAVVRKRERALAMLRSD